jgi:hypothetical protein
MACDDILLRVRRPFLVFFFFVSLVGRYFLLRNIIRHSEGCVRMAPIPIELSQMKALMS